MLTAQSYFFWQILIGIGVKAQRDVNWKIMAQLKKKKNTSELSTVLK